MGLIISALCILIGIGGMTCQSAGLRVFLWLASIPSAYFGVLALRYGGFADPFTPFGLFWFCAIALWPAIGCLIGEFIIKPGSKTSETNVPKRKRRRARARDVDDYEDMH